MALISIILGLLIDRTFRQLHDLRDMAWFEFYAQTIRRFTNKFNSKAIPALQFILIIAPPVSLIFFIQFLLDDFLFNMLGFAFGIVIFIYCLGPACLSTDIESYINARTTGDDDEALHYASSITGSTASSLPDKQIIDVTRAILYAANERIFSTIFWFIILGPFGAILYRLISELSKLSEHEIENLNQQNDDNQSENEPEDINDLSSFSDFIHSLMSWAPARMLAAGYALTGNFDSAYQSYKNRITSTDISQSNYETLVTTGLGAMHNTEMTNELAGVYAAQALVMRGVIVWIGILAVMTLGGILN